MAVTFLRSYQGYATGAVVAFDASTEAALVAQGFATVATGVPTQTNTNIGISSLGEFTIGGNVIIDETGSGLASPLAPQGPRIWGNGPLLAFAGLGVDTTPVAGTLYICEMYVPYKATWTGLRVLNGSVAATDNLLVALYDTNGILITNSALAGVTATGVNTFQNVPFNNTVTLQPGRYFNMTQFNGTTTKFRPWTAANGSNQMTTSISGGTFGTIPTSFTPPTTFTTAVGPIAALYA